MDIWPDRRVLDLFDIELPIILAPRSSAARVCCGLSCAQGRRICRGRSELLHSMPAGPLTRLLAQQALAKLTGRQGTAGASRSGRV